MLCLTMTSCWKFVCILGNIRYCLFGFFFPWLIQFYIWKTVKLCVRESDFFNEGWGMVILFFLEWFLVGADVGKNYTWRSEKKIMFLLLPRAFGSCFMRRVQCELREIWVVAELVSKGSFHQPWPFSRHLGSVFSVCNELLRQFFSCTSVRLLSLNCWPKLAGQGLMIGFMVGLTTTAHSGWSLAAAALSAEAGFVFHRRSLKTGKIKGILYYFTLFDTVGSSALVWIYCSSLKKIKTKRFCYADGILAVHLKLSSFKVKKNCDTQNSYFCMPEIKGRVLKWQ